VYGSSVGVAMSISSSDFYISDETVMK